MELKNYNIKGLAKTPTYPELKRTKDSIKFIGDELDKQIILMRAHRWKNHSTSKDQQERAALLERLALLEEYFEHLKEKCIEEKETDDQRWTVKKDNKRAKRVPIKNEP